jgi:predicted phage terminase large subunit-like protein
MRIAIVAETSADARDVLVEGPSGILAVSPESERPIYEPSKRRLTWPNGAVATTYNGTEPDQLRGPEHDTALVDELAKYKYAQDCLDNLQFGMRVGNDPRVMVTTTPRPIPVIRSLLKDPGTVFTRGSTFDNAANLPKAYIDTIRKKYEGTRLGRQELFAEILDDLPGALWTRATLEAAFIRQAPEMRRIVVAVDPSGTGGEDDDGDSIGIIVAGLGIDGRGYVLDDRTCKLSPDGWGRRAVQAYREYRADRIIAERNFGGAMVEHVIRTVDPNASYREVTASRGKVARAEPVAALYEQGRVSHQGGFPELEDQLCQIGPSGYVGEGSPDRADALVWALHELMLEPQASYEVRELIL